MPKEKPREITVVTFYDGRQDGQQVLIDLILNKECGLFGQQLDGPMPAPYNYSKVFSDVHANEGRANEQYI